MKFETKKSAPSSSALSAFSAVRTWVAKTFGLSTYAKLWLAGNEDSLDTREIAKPFANSAWVYVAVSKLARNLAGLPLMFSTADEDVVESGPLVELLDNPNPDMSQTEFLEQTVGHLFISGRVHWVFSQMSGLQPTQLDVIGGSQTKPEYTIDGDYRIKRLAAWKYEPGDGLPAVQIPRDACVTLRLFNPYDPICGLSPTTPGKLPISADYHASTYNDAALKNAAEPGGVLQTDQMLTEDQVKLLRESWNARHAGAANAKKAAILYGGLSWQQVASNNTDMQFVDLRKMSREEVLALWDVPPSVAGIFSDSNYAHDLSARRGFMTLVIGPLADRIADAINKGVAPRFGREGQSSPQRTRRAQRRVREFIARQAKQQKNRPQLYAWFDMAASPVVAEMIAESQEKILARADKIPINALIEAHDLPYEKLPWGDDVLVPATLSTARMVVEDAANPPEPAAPEGQEILTAEDAENAEQETELQISSFKNKGSSPSVSAPSAISAVKMTEREKGRLWRSYVRQTDAVAKVGKQRIRRFFLGLEKRIQANLPAIVANPTLRGLMKNALTGTLQTKADGVRILRLIFDLRQETGRLVAAMRAVYEAGAALGVDQVQDEAAVPDEEREGLKKRIMADPRITEFARQKEPILARTLAVVRERVAAQVAEGLDAGETAAVIAKRVETAMGTVKNRSLTIARTETSQIVGTARSETMKAAGVSGKAWLTSADGNVRASHVTAGQTYGPDSPIAVDQPFVVGGAQLMHPCDPSGPPEEIINCRCVSIARKLVA